MITVTKPPKTAAGITSVVILVDYNDLRPLVTKLRATKCLRAVYGKVQMPGMSGPCGVTGSSGLIRWHDSNIYSPCFRMSSVSIEIEANADRGSDDKVNRKLRSLLRNLLHV